MAGYDNIELLLAPDEDFSSPQSRAAMTRALRRQNALGAVGQLMGVEPTAQAGSAMQEQAGLSLRQALLKQQAAKEAAARAEERKLAQENWQRNYDEQRRQFGIQESRLAAQRADEGKKRFQHAVDPVTGEMRLYDTTTGEWVDGPPAGGRGAPQMQPERPPVAGFPGLPPGGKPLTEGQNKNFLGASTMATTLPSIEEQIAKGWAPSQIDKFAAGPMLPGWQKALQGVVPHSFASKEGEQYFAAGRQIVGAILRPESGGAITEDEWTEYGPQWLPWPGDSKELREVKIARLRNRMEAMGTQTGPAARYWQAPQPGQQAQGAPQGSGRNFEAEYNLLPGGQ